jgi:hypothetical protein
MVNERTGVCPQMNQRPGDIFVAFFSIMPGHGLEIVAWKRRRKRRGISKGVQFIDESPFEGLGREHLSFDSGYLEHLQSLRSVGSS